MNGILNFKFSIVTLIIGTMVFIGLWETSNVVLTGVVIVTLTVAIVAFFLELLAANNNQGDEGEKKPKTDTSATNQQVMDASFMPLAKMQSDGNYDTGPDGKKAYMAMIGADPDNK